MRDHRLIHYPDFTWVTIVTLKQNVYDIVAQYLGVAISCISVTSILIPSLSVYRMAPVVVCPGSCPRPIVCVAVANVTSLTLIESNHDVINFIPLNYNVKVNIDFIQLAITITSQSL